MQPKLSSVLPGTLLFLVDLESLELGLSKFKEQFSIHEVEDSLWMSHLRIVLRNTPAEMLEGLHLPMDILYYEAKEQLLHTNAR